MPDSLHAKIIFDTPAKEDAFAGQGHARTARALSEGINQIFRNGGGAIGLEGPFGSGKSTVIGFADDQLREANERAETDARYHVFTFDLWMHQTDEFRRAFLETFLDFVGDAKFVHQVNLEEERDNIRNRKKVVVTENKQRYTANGLMLIFALPWLPLIYAWLNPTAFVNNSVLKNAGFIVLVILIAALLIGARLAWDTYHRIDEKTRKLDKTLGDKLVRAGSEFLTISKKVKDEESTQWIRDEDPTTVEFQETFDRILSKVQVGTNRIVFVLDNIDRLPEDAVKDAWSEMRALFTGRSKKDNQPVVVVVPYDQKVVLHAFGHVENKDVPTPEWDIFTKTFNRILKVSPPVGSHWGKYLQDALVEAFDDQVNEKSRYKILRLVQFDFRSKLQHATPRKIVGFVNELGAYWTQWGELIPVESIAYFVIFRRQIEKDANSLLDPALVANGHSMIVGQDDLLTHLASLHFNVDPKHAVEVLLGDRVVNALVAPSSDELAKLKGIEGFERFFQSYLVEGLETATQWQADKIAQAAQNIGALSLTGPIAEDVAGVLAGALHKLVSIGRDDDDVVQGMLALLKLQPAHHLVLVANFLRARIAREYSENDKAAYEEGIDWGNWMIEIQGLIRETVSPDHAAEFWQQPMPTADVDFAFGVAYVCEGTSDTRFWDIPQHVDLQDIVNVLDNYIDDRPRAFRDTIIEIDEHLSAQQRADIITKTATALSSAEIEGDPLNYLVDVYWTLDNHFQIVAKQPATTQLRALVSDGTLLHYAYKSHGASDWATCSKVLYLIAKSQGTTALSLSSSAHPVFGSLADPATWYTNVLAGEELDEAALDALAVLVAVGRRMGSWIEAAKRDGPGSLTHALISKAIDTGKIGAVSIAVLRDNFQGLESVIGPDGLQALFELPDQTIFYNDVTDDDLTGLPLHFIKALGAWSPNPKLVGILDRLDAKLKALSQEEWQQALTEGAPVVDLLLERIAVAGLTLPPSNFMAPFKEVAIQVLEGVFNIGQQNWNDLFKALPAANRKAVAKLTLTEMRGVTSAGAEAFILNYSDMATVMPLEEAPENAIDKLLRELVPAGSESVREHIRKSKKAYKKAFAKVSDDTRASLVEVIDGLGEAGTDGASEWAQELRDLLGIKRVEAKEILDEKGGGAAE